MLESRIQFGLVATCESTRIVLPLKAVQCDFLVEGGLAQVTVTQVFFQENKAPLDCLYQFPLPADASVYACEAQINDRVIRAKVEEREAARKLVKQKKAEGRRTALVESERENLFTLSLGNLQPDDLIEVRLAYLQPLRRSAGSLSMTVPFCPGIRYIPGHPLLRSNRGKGVVDDTDQVPDASRISPVRMDQFHPDAAFVGIGGRVEARFADAASVTCPSHSITAQSEDGFLRIELNDKGDVPDRDFVLRWEEKAVAATAPRAWIYRKDQESYALLEIRAPESISEGTVLPQDVYFLVDRSGSMAGQKWQKAVEALQNCVAVLAPQDRVMVTVFETTSNDFAEAPLPPSELLQDPNFRNLSRMGTGGGTEMRPALAHVLGLVRKHSPHRRTNLVLVTDAQVVFTCKGRTCRVNTAARSGRLRACPPENGSLKCSRRLALSQPEHRELPRRVVRPFSASSCQRSVVERSRGRGPDGRRDAFPTLRKCPGNSAPARGSYAAAKEDSEWSIQDGRTRFLRAHRETCQECTSLGGWQNAKGRAQKAEPTKPKGRG